MITRISVVVLLAVGGLANAETTITIQTKNRILRFEFPNTPQAHETFQRLSGEQQTVLHERRENFLTKAAMALESWFRVMRFAQPFVATAVLAVGQQTWHFLPAGYFEELTRVSLEKFDTVLCENAELTVKADRIGGGIGIAGAYGAAVEDQAHGNALHLFFAVDSNLSLKDYALRIGLDRERLQSGTPAFLSGGLALRFFVYTRNSEGQDSEQGFILHPGAGPSYLITNHTFAARSNIGLWLPSLVTLIAQSKVQRYTITPGNVFRSAAKALRNCMDRLRG